ncbi:phytanoyl-CoA dioxygenase family protein [Marinoscillum furvescens]|uniref:Phytanoyl-CoA dioxygenase PhyH n=1 Tax=Marinoscillum furvescens DSM 4134 TaxID=1122208 RepID=A0A3D9KWP4_MARFU|nr:phytanoyl-CoA dioxygenase family protein [Marinoscillum furvescens]RED92310.1 phytanoyl-CoA dioxygenase PhyH [Marinoscillum furvescens DSM 4134]
MNRIFKEDQFENELSEKGYLKIRLIDNEKVKTLLDVYSAEMTNETAHNSKYGLYVTLEEWSTEKSLAIEQRVEELLREELESYFLSYKTHLGGFLVKNPDPNGYTYPHQDWTFVDHGNYRSVTVWIALMPIDLEQSTLGFAPESVSLFNKYPVGTPVTIMKSGTSGHEFQLYDHLDFQRVEPGEAFVFDNRTVHAASPNTSSKPRIAYALTLSPPEAPLYHYLYSKASGKDELIQLEVDRAFFHDYTIESADEYYNDGRLPEGYPVISRIAPVWKPMDPVKLKNYLASIQKNGLTIGATQHSETSSNWIKKLKNKLSNAFQR